MMKMFVFLLPPELSLTEMLKMSVTPCGSSSLIVSSLSQSISGTHLITPLQVFSVPWGLAVTWQPAKLSSLLTVHIRLWEAVVTWMIRSPDRRRLISLTLPIAVFIAWIMAVPGRLNDKPTVKGVHLVCLIVQDFEFCTGALVTRRSIEIRKRTGFHDELSRLQHSCPSPTTESQQRGTESAGLSPALHEGYRGYDSQVYGKASAGHAGLMRPIAT